MNASSASSGSVTVWVTGWRIGLQLGVGMALFGGFISYMTWYTYGEVKSGFLEFFTIASAALGALLWGLLWQRVEIDRERALLRVRNLNTAWRWRTFEVRDLERLRYFTNRSGVNALWVCVLHQQTVAVTIMEDSLAASGGSRFTRAVAAELQRLNPAITVDFSP